MRIILECNGYGKDQRRIERADKRDRKLARKAKRQRRQFQGAVA